MILLALVSVLVGAVLGLRFKVFILVPVIAVAWVLLTSMGTNTAAGDWSTLVSLIVVAASVQVGYLCGIATRLVLVAARTSRRVVRWPGRSRGAEGSVGPA